MGGGRLAGEDVLAMMCLVELDAPDFLLQLIDFAGNVDSYKAKAVF